MVPVIAITDEAGVIVSIFEKFAEAHRSGAIDSHTSALDIEMQSTNIDLSQKDHKRWLGRCLQAKPNICSDAEIPCNCHFRMLQVTDQLPVLCMFNNPP